MEGEQVVNDVMTRTTTELQGGGAPPAPSLTSPSGGTSSAAAARCASTGGGASEGKGYDDDDGTIENHEDANKALAMEEKIAFPPSPTPSLPNPRDLIPADANAADPPPPPTPSPTTTRHRLNSYPFPHSPTNDGDREHQLAALAVSAMADFRRLSSVMKSAKCGQQQDPQAFADMVDEMDMESGGEDDMPLDGPSSERRRFAAAAQVESPEGHELSSPEGGNGTDDGTRDWHSRSNPCDNPASKGGDDGSPEKLNFADRLKASFEEVPARRNKEKTAGSAVTASSPTSPDRRSRAAQGSKDQTKNAAAIVEALRLDERGREEVDRQMRQVDVAIAKSVREKEEVVSSRTAAAAKEAREEETLVDVGQKLKNTRHNVGDGANTGQNLENGGGTNVQTEEAKDKVEKKESLADRLKASLERAPSFLGKQPEIPQKAPQKAKKKEKGTKRDSTDGTKMGWSLEKMLQKQSSKDDGISSSKEVLQREVPTSLDLRGSDRFSVEGASMRSDGSSKSAEEAAKEPDQAAVPKRPPRPKTARRKPSKDFAHTFREHTYGAPTHCDICNGLLVGLWSQGLKCDMCGFDVHRGEGIGDHDDCRAEALLRPCPGPAGSLGVAEAETPVGLRDALAQVRELVKTSPHLLQDVKEQIDKDLKAHARAAIITTSVEEERSKKLRRTKSWVIQFLRVLDSVDARGQAYACSLLLVFQFLVSGLTATISLVAFVLALWPRHGLLSSTAVSLAANHSTTVTAALDTTLLVLAFVLCRLARLFQRKVIIVDNFLREVVRIKAEDDLGVSVAEAAARTRQWSDRAFCSAALSWIFFAAMWHVTQPSREDFSDSGDADYCKYSGSV